MSARAAGKARRPRIEAVFSSRAGCSIPRSNIVKILGGFYAKEDAEGEYKGVTFTVEVLGEDGEPLDSEVAASRSLRQPKREKKIADDDLDDDDEEDGATVAPVSVTYETNGNVNPHRVTVRLEGESEMSEGLTISISRSGKATVGEEEEENGRGHAKRSRRR